MTDTFDHTPLILQVNGCIAKPLHGKVELNADGSVTYAPNAGFEGLDTFYYAITAC